MVKTLLTILTSILIYYVVVLGKDLYQHHAQISTKKLVPAIIIGFITDFLDTLGIGSFAPTTLLFKATNYLDNDKQLPGTLNVSHTIPTMVESFMFITAVKVAPLTLFSLVFAAVLGSWFGSRKVVNFSEQTIQRVMGFALLATAFLMAAKHLGWIGLLGQGNDATALTGIPLVIGIVGNFILGVLMTLGVGLYAPCMAMVYMLGLNPLVAFPIMMASCAGIMPVAGVKFIKSGNYSREGVIGIIIGGTAGVFVAANFVKSLNVEVLTWAIIAVIVYTGVYMLVKNYQQRGKMLS